MKMTCAYQGKIKVFADGADRASILELLKNPLVKGFTTNPSLMKQAGVQDYAAFAKELLTHLNGLPVSYEVFADDFDSMARQALEIKSWERAERGGSADQIYVKIPITNSTGASAIPLIRDLARQKVKLNVTALFTLEQVRETCEALKGGAPSLVSVFAGRIADAGYDPEPLMKESAKLCQAAGPQVELLWASSREPFNLVQAERTGCQVITMTPDQIKKIKLFGKDLAQYSLETVQGFKKDAEAAGFQL